MARLLALPLAAIVIGILACGTTATEVLPNSAPATSPVQVPTDAPAADSGAQSTPTSVTTVTSSLEPTPDVPGPTSPPDSTVAAASTAFPDSQTATSPPRTTPGPTPAPTVAPPKLAIIVDQPGLGTDVGKTLPNFEFTLFDGTRRNTAQISGQGRPVFLYFFATW